MIEGYKKLNYLKSSIVKYLVVVTISDDILEEGET